MIADMFPNYLGLLNGFSIVLPAVLQQSGSLDTIFDLWWLCGHCEALS